MRHGLVRLAVALLSLAGCSVVSIDLTPRVRPLEESTVEGSGADKVLLIDLAGVLAEEPIFTLESRPQVPLLARVREELEKAEDDDRVRAVVLRINSPGGTVTASDILYHEVMRFKARRKVPVVASILDVGASGGYYVALAADRILVHPTTVTGSIGVLMLTVNASGLLEKIGVSASYVKSGEFKDMGSPFRSLRPEERALFQDLIDRFYGRFVELVARSRKLDEARVRAIADGRDLHRRRGAVARAHRPDRVPRGRDRRGEERRRPHRGQGGHLPPAPPVPRDDLLRDGSAGAGGRSPGPGAHGPLRAPLPLPLVAVSTRAAG